VDFANQLQFNTKGYCINEVLPEDHGAKLLQFLFRPERVETEIAPVYNEQPVLGMSHPYATYSHTAAQVVSFDMYWNALMGMKEKGRFYAGGARSTSAEGGATQLKHFGDKFEDARRFWEALCVPPESVEGALGGTPPATALLVLPGVCALRVRLWALRFTFEEHDRLGHITALRASLTFHEVPRARFTMEEVLESGSFRC
jgi:hypothetical protein